MITITWGKDDKSIMTYTFEGEWTVDDLIEALDAGMEVSARYDHHIDVIADLSASGIPNLMGGDIGGAFKRAMSRSEDHMKDRDDTGVVVVVSKNPIIRNSLGSMMKLYKRLGDTLMMADTPADALATIDHFHGRRKAVSA